MAAYTGPVWQVFWGSPHSLGWVDLDTATSASMEAAFVDRAIQSKPIGVGRGSVTQSLKFDVNRMSLAHEPVRRCKSTDDMDSPAVVEYWDDNAWIEYDKFSTCLIAEALRIKRSSITVYLGVNTFGLSNAYDIHLDRANMLQTNRGTGRMRPLRLTACEAFDENDADDDGAVVVDDGTMPHEFYCPITMMPMVCPVVAADGHTYEKRAIVRALMIKLASPVTGKDLYSNLLFSNYNLRKMIRDHVAAQKTDQNVGGKASCSTHGIKNKKMRKVASPY